jgi:hypothetical protein
MLAAVFDGIGVPVGQAILARLRDQYTVALIACGIGLVGGAVVVASVPEKYRRGATAIIGLLGLGITVLGAVMLSGAIHTETPGPKPVQAATQVPVGFNGTWGGSYHLADDQMEYPATVAIHPGVVGQEVGTLHISVMQGCQIPLILTQSGQQSLQLLEGQSSGGCVGGHKMTLVLKTANTIDMTEFKASPPDAHYGAAHHLQKAA